MVQVRSAEPNGNDDDCLVFFLVILANVSVDLGMFEEVGG